MHLDRMAHGVENLGDARDDAAHALVQRDGTLVLDRESHVLDELPVRQLDDDDALGSRGCDSTRFFW